MSGEVIGNEKVDWLKHVCAGRCPALLKDGELVCSPGATWRLGEAKPPQCVTQASPDSEVCNKNLTDSVDVFGFVQREYCKHNLWLTLIN